MFFLVDAFTDQKFKGNPAGIFVVEEFPSKQIMQQLASFFRFPDLAFVKRIDHKNFRIRWFSPLDESPICGHATIAAAHVIFTKVSTEINDINFVYNDGELGASRSDRWITIVFKAPHVDLCENIQFDTNDIIGLRQFDSIYYDKYSYMIFLTKGDDIFNINPNFTAIKNLDKRSLIVTSPGVGEYDFCLRYFAPKVGINEDSVCGSANCKASVIWGKKLNKQRMISYQASEREGVMQIIIDEKNNKVSISGSAMTICEFEDYNIIDISTVF